MTIYRMKKIPSSADYVHALELLSLQNKVSEMHKEILFTQYHSPDRTIPASEIGARLGCHTIVINSYYGRLGHMIADILQLNPGLRETGGYRWWAVLSEGWTEGKFQWRMHDSVAYALEELGWISLSLSPLTEEVDTDFFPLNEGAVQRIYINAFERNTHARAKCIEHFGCQCVVCGFEFSKVYGSLGQSFIHVHHLIPLSEISEAYEVNPIKDLRPVCPNCHAMLHRKKPPLSIEELQNIMRNCIDE